MAFRFLSFGAGIQSTALLLMHKQLHVDEIIFSDTGGEWPETYEHISERVIPYCEKEGLPFVILKGDQIIKEGIFKRLFEHHVDNLEEFCLYNQTTPSRNDRWCTARFKIDPIRNYIRNKGIEFPATALMGISYDEISRIHETHWKEYIFEYPLIERQLNREDCKKIILEHGWSLPHKSGCFYCPFMRRSQAKELYYNHPGHYDRAVDVEKSSPRYPKYTLIGKPLELIAESLGSGSSSLDSFIEKNDEPCDSGFCMV